MQSGHLMHYRPHTDTMYSKMIAKVLQEKFQKKKSFADLGIWTHCLVTVGFSKSFPSFLDLKTETHAHLRRRNDKKYLRLEKDFTLKIKKMICTSDGDRSLDRFLKTFGKNSIHFDRLSYKTL